MNDRNRILETLESERPECEEIFALLSGKSVEERAYMVIKAYSQMEDAGICSEDGEPDAGWTDRVHRLFLKWLLSPENAEAKDRAMERVFLET